MLGFDFILGLDIGIYLQGTLTTCQFSNSIFFLKLYAKGLLMVPNEKPQLTKILALIESGKK